jgi:alpha-1,3-fucosyltransferase
MTYRSDSDVFYSYGETVQLSKPKSELYLTPTKIRQLTTKPKLIAWIVSSCRTPSRRESFVKELQKYVPVDIYGACGSLKCPSGNCYQHVALQYKFYLSFENSLCKDYVTEKLFQALQTDMVPIVYGWANYSQISPPNSFIDFYQSSSVKDLAKYLLHLNSHDSEYLEYFSWKGQYQILRSNKWCDFCRKLSHNNERKYYSDIHKWWNNAPTREEKTITSEKSDLTPAPVPVCFPSPIDMD